MQNVNVRIMRSPCENSTHLIATVHGSQGSHTPDLQCGERAAFCVQFVSGECIPSELTTGV